MKKKRGKEADSIDERIVNLSLPDSDISNRGRVIFRETKNTWEIEKKLRLRIRGDEGGVIEYLVRMEQL